MKRALTTSIFYLFLFFTFLTQAQDVKDWFVFDPAYKKGKAETDMNEWLEIPAGKHGFVQIKGEQLEFEDRTPIKFWGANVASELPFMNAKEAKQWAIFLSRYGFNGVRFHKFTWEATDGIHSTTITPGKWKNFDFLCNELRKKGIYYGWSHIYGHRVLAGDSLRVTNYHEITSNKARSSHLIGTTSSLVNFAEDLQALNIELTVNMLNHVNPLTGLRYADDPALSFVEFQNEDNIFWASLDEILSVMPTYRGILCVKFSRWLKEKYGSSENLRKAWNNEGLVIGESLAAENIYPVPSHGMFSWENDQAIKENRPMKKFFLDRADFLYFEQMKFYHKFEAAVRQTGYKGPLIGSCWQAGTGLTHLLNLKADFEIGIIDRHNYFGGGEGYSLKPGMFDNSAMVSHIGSGLLSTGLQQISDRPFVISEWMSLIPNEWTAESAPIIATYGMGLQGWDASYVFATDSPYYTPSIQNPEGGIYNATSPTQLALYPALTRMIYRRDVKEGNCVVNRNVNLLSLLKGETLFKETVTQDYDRKSIVGSFPQQLMAAGKVLLTFNTTNNLILSNDISSLWKDSSMTSTTGQLTWSEVGKGFFTLNTPGTKGLVGFAKDKIFKLGEVTLKTNNDFAVILISSLDKDKTILSSHRILVTALARARNTGMKYNADHSKLLEIGKAPIVLEPVKFSLSIDRKSKPKMTVLDHSGYKTAHTIKSVEGSWILDGSHTKAIYYLIEY